METRNCPKCGKLFSYISSKICNDCLKKEEELFEKVKEYIRENPSNTLRDIVENTGVSGRKILGYIKEGRITITKGLSGEVRCEHCGKQIENGKFCDSCIIKLNNDVNEVFSKSKEVPRAKMHTRS